MWDIKLKNAGNQLLKNSGNRSLENAGMGKNNLQNIFKICVIKIYKIRKHIKMRRCLIL